MGNEPATVKLTTLVTIMTAIWQQGSLVYFHYQLVTTYTKKDIHNNKHEIVKISFATKL